MAGLGAAYELSKGEHAVTIFEGKDILGGLASSYAVNGVALENFYHHLFPTYRDFLAVAKELHIENKIYFRKVMVGNFCNGHLYSFAGPLDLIRFSPISIIGRIRTGFFMLYLKLKRNWHSFERVTAVAWMRSRFGESAYHVLWGRLLESKFANRAKYIGMVWMWAKIFERPSRLGYINGGFSTFISALENRLRERGVYIRLGAPAPSITELRRDGYDAIIVAAPQATLLRLASDFFPTDYVAKINALEYIAVVCAVVVLKKHLTEYYWINVLEEDSPFVGVIEQTNLVREDTYHGLHPVYLTRYVAADDPFYKLSDEDVQKSFIAYLKHIRSDFDESWIEEFRIFRAPYAQPVVPSGYGELRPSFRTPVADIWWVSMAHTYPWDRGTGHSFRLGRDLAQELLAAQK